MTEEKFEEMSLIGHLTELRKRLLWSFLYILFKKLLASIDFYWRNQTWANIGKKIL